jgi:hypothetical protein
MALSHGMWRYTRMMATFTIFFLEKVAQNGFFGRFLPFKRSDSVRNVSLFENLGAELEKNRDTPPGTLSLSFIYINTYFFSHTLIHVHTPSFSGPRTLNWRSLTLGTILLASDRQSQLCLVTNKV